MEQSQLAPTIKLLFRRFQEGTIPRESQNEEVALGMVHTQQTGDNIQRESTQNSKTM